MVREREQGLDGECGGGREPHPGFCQPGPGHAASAAGTGKFPTDLALLKIAGWGWARGLEDHGRVISLGHGQALSTTKVAALEVVGKGRGLRVGGLALLQAFALPCSGVPAPLHPAVIPPPPPGLQHP